MHLALYALMIGAPLAGWLILSAAGKPVPFFGLELPPLIDKNPSLAGDIKELHETVAVAGYWLIGLHALAGVFHHYVARDNTLVRMMPGRS
ncbi:Cytochrome b561 [compost metagenome]